MQCAMDSRDHARATNQCCVQRVNGEQFGTSVVLYIDDGSAGRREVYVETPSTDRALNVIGLFRRLGQ